ncbi:MAG: aminotransferase class V-fold PLP-dependent enzyme [Alphaproteobacteria bacterium]|nr:aminotransferase class V-fold PLP-dependent enzyme [Alphaproteobacteria bacterium]
MIWGRAALAEFGLDPARIYLNHGGYGAVPRSVQTEQDRWRAIIERDPTGFYEDILPDAMRNAAQSAAHMFGGAANDWVFCENATQAIGGVLSSIPLAQGDEILTTSLAYGAVAKAMQQWAARRGLVRKTAEILPFLESDAQVIDAVTGAFSKRTRLLVIDHITSSTAAVFPIAEIARAAKAHGVAVLVDGAHATGQIALDVPALGVDWYTGNAHKWLFAPRGCALLWTAPSRQQTTRPAVLSWGADESYTAAFDWIGTRDVSPWLCLPSACEAFTSFGGPALMARNRALALEGASMLSERLGLVPSAPPAMRAAMVAFGLPGTLQCSASMLRRTISEQFGISLPVFEREGRLWLRASAQKYNEMADFEALADALRQLLPKS